MTVSDERGRSVAGRGFDGRLFVWLLMLSSVAISQGTWSLTPLFFKDELRLGEQTSLLMLQFLNAFVSVSSVCAGILADRVLGLYVAKMAGMVLTVTGVLILSLSTDVAEAMVGLMLFCVGASLDGVTVYPLLGQMSAKVKTASGVSRGYTVGYVMGNVGSLSVLLVAPTVRSLFGYGAGFMSAAVLELCSLVAMFACRKRFAGFTPPRNVGGRLRVGRVFDPRAASPVAILLVLGCVIVSYVCGSISSNMWVYFADRGSDLDLSVFGARVRVDQLGIVNPITIVLAAPLFDLIWRRADPKGDVRYLTKMGLGYLIFASGAGVMCAAGFLYRDTRFPTGFYLAATAICAVHELFAVAVLFRLLYVAACEHAKSTAVMLLTLVGLPSSLIFSALLSFYTVDLARYFILFQALAMALAAVTLLLVRNKVVGTEGEAAALGIHAAERG